MVFPGGEGASGVVILGTARSGTSALTSMFISAGFYAGAPSALMAPNYANPRGYFERNEIIELNDEILREAGASWFRPPRSGSGWEPSAADRDRARAALDALRAEAGVQPMVIKDPRMCQLLDLWLPLLADRFAPVVTVRDPLEVAASLNKRDGTPLPFALGAWELLWSQLLRWLSGARVTVAPYSALGTPGVAERVVADAAAVLDPERGHRVESALAAAPFDTALWHNVAAAIPLSYEEALTPRQLKLWRWLDALEPGAQTVAVPEDLLVEHRLAWDLVDAESARRETLQRAAVLEKLLVAHEREMERLRELVRSEQARLEGELGAANDVVREQEARHERETTRLHEVIHTEQARLESEVRELQDMLESTAARSEP
jgi:hypothetical protein